MNLHEQARAEAERMAEHVWAAWTGAEGELLRGATIQGFLAGHEAAAHTREVTTVDELDALPIGSVVLDHRSTFPEARQKFSTGWWVAGEECPLAAADILLPARVLYDPEETP